MPITNNYKSNFYDFADVEVRPNDTFLSLFGKPKNHEEFMQITRDPKYIKLHEKYVEIFATGDDCGLKTAETQVLIHQYSDGLPLHEIEYRRLEDVRLYIIANAKNYLAFVNPELHAFLLRTNYFNKNKDEMEKPHRVQRISRIVKKIMNGPDAPEKLKRFSEIISNQ